jgi:UDP-glucose 4-epimerase
MERILVTGGAGYIGSHTAVALVEAGFEPVLLDNFSNSQREAVEGIEAICGRAIQLIEADCTREEAVEHAFETAGPFAGIIHFAAFKAVGESVAEPLKYWRNNVAGTAVVLEVARRRGCEAFVFSSSCTVYGEPEQVPVDEEAPVRPATSPYGATKQVGEQLIRDLAAAWPEFRAMVLRYFNPVGAHPSAAIGEWPLGVPNNLVPYLTQAVARVRPPLTVFGDDYPTQDGTCIRDYIHVVDLAEAHVRALEVLLKKQGAAGSTVVNLGTGKGSSVLEVVRAFEAATGVQVPHRIGERRAGDAVEVWADASRAEEVLGWRARLTVEDALRDAWRWQQRLTPA